MRWFIRQVKAWWSFQDDFDRELFWLTLAILLTVVITAVVFWDPLVNGQMEAGGIREERVPWHGECWVWPEGWEPVMEVRGEVQCAWEANRSITTRCEPVAVGCPDE